MSSCCTISQADARLLARKPPRLTYEQASTLPAAYTTAHESLCRAQLAARSWLQINAAGGGPGLVAAGYGHFIGAKLVASSVRAFRHYHLQRMGVELRCSSRDGAALAFGVGQQMCCFRIQAVLNSLSLDFVSVSHALLGEWSSFEEIGKRSVWSIQRSPPWVRYSVIALDTDMALDPDWMHRSLELLSTRADAGVVASLPLQSFEMELQFEQAFRLLQSGRNLGKVVVRIASKGADVLRAAVEGSDVLHRVDH